MNTIKPSEINTRIASQVKRFAETLFPEGKKQGDEWVVGSVNGEKGQSCHINLQGKGFIDRATGESGDYIQLWMENKSCDFPTAIEECKAWLGIDEPERKKIYAKPTKPKTIKRLTKPVGEYLKNRGLSVGTIKDFKIVEDEISGQPAITFPYMRNGELIHFKKLGLDRPDGKKQIMTSPKTEPCLFGWQVVPKVKIPFIIICEGEIDAMSWYEYGLYALSVPFGGGDGAKQEWIATEYPNLAQFETILISMDSDEPGRIAASCIANRLGIDRCKLVELPKKDINECLTSKIPLETIVTCCDTAKLMDIEGIKSPMDYKQETYDWMFEDNSLKGIETPWPKVNEVARLDFGGLSLWNGINGHGKSDVVNHCLIHAAFHGIATLVCSPELREPILLSRFIKQSTGQTRPTKILFDKCFEEFHEKIWLTDIERGQGKKSDRLLELMEYAFRRYNTRLFVIDSLMKMGISDDDYNGQKEFIERLADFKNRTNTHVMLVTHSRKADNEERPSGKMDVKGSGSITDLVDSIFIVHRNKGRERLVDALDDGSIKREELSEKQQHILDQGGVYLDLCKNRINSKEKNFKMFYNSAFNQLVEYESAHPHRYIDIEHQGIKGVVNG